MSSERWERVKRLVDGALARAGEDRARYLEETCAGDATLRAEVESLLRHDGQGPLETKDDVEPSLAGTGLGHYRVIEEIGRGGMGRVYRALDGNLGRHVAIKVLPEGIRADPQRVRRFEREARLVASLNHPGIAAIHGLERLGEGEAPFLVLELIEGQTLQQRLGSGRIPVEEALDLARQIAGALEAAHERGVVHRDLKPSNVAVTEDGVVKVLDFGLAKALSGSSSRDEEAATGSGDDPPTTRDGLILGTPPYMSPEQVGGKRVDHRSDVWSFGVVLFEMLSGTRVFQGGSTSEVLGAVLRDEPDWGRLPESTPARVRSLLQRCLTRDRRNRLQAIGEARILLESADSAEPEPTRRRGASAHPSTVAGGVALVVASLAAGWALRSLAVPGPLPKLVRGDLLPAPGTRLMPGAGFAMSPDGERLAFVAEDADGVPRLWLRSLSASEARALPDTADASQPFWSPDGRQLGFFAESELRTTPATGGPVSVLADAPDPRGGAWGPGGRIVYAPISRTGLLEVPASGGDPQPLTTLGEGELSHRFPSFVPGEDRLVMLVQTAEPGALDDRSRIELLERDGTRHELLRVNSSGALTASGLLLFWQEGALLARALDPASQRLRGEARALAHGVGINAIEWAGFAVATSGPLVYHPEFDPLRRLEVLETDGSRSPLDVPPGDYRYVMTSPGGDLIAYVGGVTTIWVLDAQRGTQTRMTFETVDYYTPHWSPDGEWLIYSANATDGPGGRIFRQPASGLGERELLHSSSQRIEEARSSPDGRQIVFIDGGEIRFLDLETREVRSARANEKAVSSLRAVTSGHRQTSFSPDGRWLAYCSDEGGRMEVFVIPTSGGAGRWQVSPRGGCFPSWDPSGGRLLYLDRDGAIQAVAADLGSAPRFGVPEPVLSADGSLVHFEFMADGRLLLVTAPAERPPAFRLIQEWPLLLEPGRE